MVLELLYTLFGDYRHKKSVIIAWLIIIPGIFLIAFIPVTSFFLSLIMLLIVFSVAGFIEGYFTREWAEAVGIGLMYAPLGTLIGTILVFTAYNFARTHSVMVTIFFGIIGIIVGVILSIVSAFLIVPFAFIGSVIGAKLSIQERQEFEYKTVVQQLYCPFCGAKNPPYARYCAECGKSITE
ncbi:MAG: zinc ribbon domain-containing protein [Candidatus Hodarchaeota archaeon]